MTTMTTGAARNALTELGWPHQTTFTAAIEAFQRGWNLSPPLAVDGIRGPLTSAALELSLERHRSGWPTASHHFNFSEFACRCAATLPGCAGISVHRGLLVGLERLREAFYPGGLAVLSGYRCPLRNKEAGGKPDSQHLYGAAADVGYRVGVSDVEGLRMFSGIGYSISTGLVRHVDVRHLSGHDGTGGTMGKPTTWPYAA